MNIIITFLNSMIVLLMYYIFKIYFNHKMKFILIVTNCLTILCFLINAIFIGNQELSDHLFGLGCLNIFICVYYLFDKSNYKLYSILAETKTIPIMIGINWIWKEKKEIDNVVEFFNSNTIFMNKNKDINIIMLTRNKKTMDISFIFSKKADVGFYKDNIVNNSSCKVNSRGRFLMVVYERNY
ncbi:MAG: hypothetical protein ACOWWH_13890 [Eubacteriaceae bacterium]